MRAPALAFFLSLSLFCSAQLDSTAIGDWRTRHKPGRAALFSAIVPGAGQIYNRKYWKAPIVWVGLGTCVYFIRENTKQYERYRDDYIAIIDDDPSTTDEFNGTVPADNLREVADTYHKWRDLSWICFGLVYALNIVDAAVDGHFVRFDVSPDLSLNLQPSFNMAAQRAVGLSLSLRL